MEVTNLNNHLKYLEINGCTLNIEEKSRLDLAFEELVRDLDTNELYFWGKIMGTVKDYYLCFSMEPSSANALVPAKRFYWCSSQSFVFACLPQVQQQHEQALSQIGSLFSGEFATVLIESKEPPTVVNAEAGIVIPPKHITELDRLAYTVREIDRSCQAVPKSSFKYTPLNQVQRNEAFKGLSREDACDLKSW